MMGLLGRGSSVVQGVSHRQGGGVVGWGGRAGGKETGMGCSWWMVEG